MNNHLPLLGPNGDVLTKTMPEGKGMRIGNSFGPFVLGRPDLLGAEPKMADYKLYLEMYNKHPYVNAAINKIVKICTNTGYEFVPRNSRDVVDSSEYGRAQAFFKQQHDIIYQLRRVYRDLLIFGDAFLYVVPNRRRQPVRLKHLAPWTMNIKAKKNGQIEYYVQKNPEIISNDDRVQFQPHEILHFKLDDPGNDLYGLSPLESLKKVVATDLFALDWNLNFFKNGATTGTILVVEEANDEDLEKNKKWLQEEYVGTYNAHKPIILTGKISLLNSSHSHKEMGFLEGQQFILETILAVLDAPPAKVGRMETANRSNSKEQDKNFRTEAVAPLQYVVESVINGQFMTDILGLQHTNFEHSKSDVRDAMEMAELNATYLEKGVLSINDVRAMLGKADVDGGDIPTIMTPLGAIPVDRLNLYFQMAAANIDTIPPTKRDPSSGEKPPQIKPSVAAGIKPATKAYVAYGGISECLKAARHDDKALRQAWAYSIDVTEIVEGIVVSQLEETLRKATKATDNDLRNAYIDRAEVLFEVAIGADNGNT